MADAVAKSPAYPSIYVLGGHLQYKDSGVDNIFNSEAGRAVLSNNNNNNNNNSPSKRHFKQCQSVNDDFNNILLRQDRYNSNHNYKNDICPQVEIDIEDVDVEEKDENRNVKARLTRRLVSNAVRSESVDSTENSEAQDSKEDARIEEKILRLKSHYEKGFAADEKCDILKKMFTGFLSGILFPKNGSRHGTKWRKRKSSDDLYREASMVLGIPCEMTDNCRCLDCQCNYFDCGDSDSETSEVSISLDDCDIEEWPSGDHNQQQKLPDKSAADVFYYEDEIADKRQEVDEEDLPTVKSATSSLSLSSSSSSASSAGHLQQQQQQQQQQQPAKPEDPDEQTLEIAAGTPVLLDHLLNTPLSCMLQ